MEKPVSDSTHPKMPRPDEPAQACDLCGSASHLVFARRGRHGTRLTTVICHGCGLVHTNPRVSEKENAEYYHNNYWGDYKAQTVPDEKFFRRRLPKIKPMLALLRPFLRPGVKVLEVGCSVGALLWSMKHLVGSTGRFIGIEAHHGHAQFAREQKELDVRAGLLHEVEHKLPPASFDLVVMNHVLEHTPSPTDVFLKVKKLLRPQGVFVVEVPNIEAPGSRLSHFFHRAHPFSFSPRTLQRLAQKAGFKVRKIEALDGDLPQTRLFAVFEKPLTLEATLPAKFVRDDALERATALRNYEKWYWLTAASLRKKVTHWKRQRV